MKNTTITGFGDFLTEGRYTFHSGFNNIDNFVNHEGEFVSLAAHDAYLAPNSMIVSDFESKKYSTILVETDRVFFDNQGYSLNKKLQYCSSFEYPKSEPSALRNKINSFINQYLQDFPSKSLIFLLAPENKQHFTSSFEKAYMEQMEKACNYFESHFFESIKAIKMRGSGLTPSGDDFIAGLLFGMHLLETQQHEMLDTIRNKTYQLSKSNNLFSNNMLRLAYYGKHFKRLHDFLNAFFYLTLTEIKPAFKELISVGDTSGADLLTGFFALLQKTPYIFKLNSNAI